MRKKIWEVLANTDQQNKLARILNYLLLTLIMLNVAVVIVESVDWIHQKYETHFLIFEFFSVAVFLVEYLLRVYSCVEDPRYSRPVLGRLKFMCTFMAIIDLVAILPSLFLLKNADTRSIRAFRLLRIFLLAKTGRYNSSIRMLGRVFISKREELAFSFGLLFFMLVVVSTFMYLVERTAQPEAFGSIPSTMWWAVATLTTVGYGDVAPVTALGKVFGAMVAILGIGLFALPTGILGSGFMEQVEKKNADPVTCPDCGKTFHAS